MQKTQNLHHYFTGKMLKTCNGRTTEVLSVISKVGDQLCERHSHTCQVKAI